MLTMKARQLNLPPNRVEFIKAYYGVLSNYSSMHVIVLALLTVPDNSPYAHTHCKCSGAVCAGNIFFTVE